MKRILNHLKGNNNGKDEQNLKKNSDCDYVPIKCGVKDICLYGITCKFKVGP